MHHGVVGPKYSNLNGIWDLKPYYLGPWTLRAVLEYAYREQKYAGFRDLGLCGLGSRVGVAPIGDLVTKNLWRLMWTPD